jgi:molybdopterin-guanine dinucleotide biosynthesis protein A
VTISYTTGMLTGVILSGGSSTRFGCEKGLVELGGRPMVSRIIQTMRPIVDEVVVAVAAGRGPEYSRLFGEDVLVVEDDVEGMGPLLGLMTALKAAHGERVAVSPCDTPLLRQEVLEMVLDRGADRDGAVPRIGGYLEPLHASYRRKTCLAAFERALEEGKRRPKDAYPLLDLAIVEEDEIRALDPDLESFMNINTRQDFSAVVSRLQPR